MIGAIAGDIIGSVWEGMDLKTTRFPLFGPDNDFTDDTVLTLAVAESLMRGTDLAATLKAYARRYPRAGYGGTFLAWARSDRTEPYNSWGNGSAMRVSPVGFAFDRLDEVLDRARWSAEVTHNHPEGIKGAQAVAAAILLARTGHSKADLRGFVEGTFGYRLDVPLDEIRETYLFDVSCQGSVPQAITAFLESDDWEDAVRKAISIGGDSDTIACMAGGIAQAFYGGVPRPIVVEAFDRLDARLEAVAFEFCKAHGCLG